MRTFLFLLITLGCVILSGCGHQPLPPLKYKAAAPLGTKPNIPVQVSLVTGQAIGHSLTSYALMPGGWTMPITSGPSPTGAFNPEDQAAFVENLVRILGERGLIHRATESETPSAEITVQFIKTEHFPEMQDYVLDVLLTVKRGTDSRDKVFHASTIDGVNLAARMFQNGVDGRRNAANLLLAVIVPELEVWLTTDNASAPPSDKSLIVQQPFGTMAPTIVTFLRERYARPSTFWKDGISIHAMQPTERVMTVELRWSHTDSLPPFCVIDLQSEGNSTRITIRERNPLLSAKTHVTEAIQEFISQLPQPADGASNPAASSVKSE